MAYNERASKDAISRLKTLESKLNALADKIHFEINKGKISGEEAEVADAAFKVRSVAQELQFLVDGISNSERGIKSGDIPENAIQIVSERLERDRISAEKKIKSALKIEREAEQVFNQFKSYKGDNSGDSDEDDKKEEKQEKAKKNVKRKTGTKPSTPKPKTGDTPAEKFKNISKTGDKAIIKFNENVPRIQKEIYEELMIELKRLDLSGDKIKTTVANLKIIQSIKSRLTQLILNDNYISDVKEFIGAFDEITKLQTEYWRTVERNFKPSPLLRAIRFATINDTVTMLTDAGIGANIAEPISDILRTNITTGGSYKDLTNQLRENLVNTQTPGTLEKYVKQITTDAVNQYSNQYTQIVSNDLGYEWFKYDNTDISTTRPFCDALTDRPYFHISEVPALLRADGLTYVNKKTGKREPVPIYEKTGLPSGMIPGTDASNFFVRRGGYNCGHSIRPVNERQVPQADKDRVYATSAYKTWKSANS